MTWASRTVIIVNMISIYLIASGALQHFGFIVLLVGAVYTICVLGEYADSFEYYFKDKSGCRKKLKVGTWISLVGLASMVDPVLAVYCI